MNLRLLYIEKWYEDQHDGYEEPVLQYQMPIIYGHPDSGKWVDVEKVYINRSHQ